MKGPSLQKTAVLSAGLHLTFFLLSFLVLRQSHDMIMPSPYTVSLVGPAGETQKRGVAAEPGEPLPAKKEPAAAPTHIDEKKDLKTIDESIAALKAKREKEKQLEKILALRKALVSIQGKGGRASSKSPVQSGSASGATIGPGEASYINKIAGQIHEEWHWPDFGKKNLEAVISIRIQKDGTLSDLKFEQKSGDRFFDRSVVQAVQKASPVVPPPYEMEIGIRFYP